MSLASTGAVGRRLPEREVVLLTNQRPTNRWYVHVTVKYYMVFRDSCIPDCSSRDAQLADGQTVFDRPSDQVSFQDGE